MKSFKQFIKESKRNKSDPHERVIRVLATIGRLSHKYRDPTDWDADIHPNKKSIMSGRTFYGECDRVSHCVADRLKSKYPSVKVVYSKKFGQPYPDDPDGSDGLTGHSWVEIPETGHYIDPSHDMFRIRGFRTNIPIRGGIFPQSAIKIGKIGDSYYKRYYLSGKKVDPLWPKGK